MTILRIVVGVVFLMHGGQKLFVYGFTAVGRSMGSMGIPLPQAAGVTVTLVEFIGGALLVLGLFTRVASLLLAINMGVAVCVVHLKSGFFLPRGFEYALTLLAGNMAILLAGPGAAALDNKVLKR